MADGDGPRERSPEGHRGHGRWARDYLHVNIWAKFVQYRLGTVVQELVRIGDVVDEDPDDGLNWGPRPPAERLSAYPERHLMVDDGADERGEAECD